jgi:prephenate dehydrogenase
MRVSIVGLGLIGGSIALDLKAEGFATEVLGVDANQDHCKAALSRQLVDEILPLDQALQRCEVMILAVPVQHIVKMLPIILDQVTDQTVIDVGSTKKMASTSVEGHPKRSNYVATHPMAGTEFSGPAAAIRGLFKDKVTIFCDAALSSSTARDTARALYECLGMPIIEMDSLDHDLHAAYVSHISHISSFALALTVLKKEKDTENIFNLASGGFDSTVRLAKSSAAMWTPIFTQNAENVLNVLDTYISELKLFREAIEQHNAEALNKFIAEANKIRRILKG